MKPIISAFFLLVFITSGNLHARAVKYRYPDELTDKSTLVCDGLVLDVTPLEHKDVMKSDGQTEPVREYSAFMKAISVLKGPAIGSFEIRFYQLDTNQMVFNGPCEFRLRNADRGRFYLKKDPTQPFYWPCLQGDLDDAQSVGPIPDSMANAHALFGEAQRDYQECETGTWEKQLSPENASKMLQLFVKCDDLKTQPIDPKIPSGQENAIIRRLGFIEKHPSKSLDSDAFMALIVKYVPDNGLRTYLMKRLSGYRR
jgi:hypothetical protein